ncbi:MAG TPA: pantoate--beta-alanine ligase, partial [bacterium]|nr:pantoate--beta-alanine ligase [bacterium]
MRVLKDIEQVRNFCDLMHSVGKKIGFVPTMGNLHDGHLSLVERAKEDNNVVGVSIFVNPIQFGPNEDFNKYPRTLDEDLEKLKSVGCDFVFVPDTNAMYLNNSSELIINEKKISKTMCGKFRQGHFDGVLTVVAKLFHICKPDKAYFGNKDYQQLILIKQMSLSLNMGVEIIGCPLVREKDGLAMSSRNSYLDSEARKKA